MTHNDIYTKFMIEYDKANVTSSYPSLTPYEIATILDKAYLALIARKLTGNNTRQAPFEYDTKAVEDLRPLIVTNKFDEGTATKCADNEHVFEIKEKDNLLYYLEGQITYNSSTDAIDGKGHKNENVIPTNHRLAERFKATNSNLPWIKQPVSFIENDFIHVLVDSYKHKDDSIVDFLATYLKKPVSFAENVYDNYPYPSERPSDDSGNGGSGGNSGDGGDGSFILDYSILDGTDVLN